MRKRRSASIPNFWFACQMRRIYECLGIRIIPIITPNTTCLTRGVRDTRGCDSQSGLILRLVLRQCPTGRGPDSFPRGREKRLQTNLPSEIVQEIKPSWAASPSPSWISKRRKWRRGTQLCAWPPGPWNKDSTPTRAIRQDQNYPRLVQALLRQQLFRLSRSVRLAQSTFSASSGPRGPARWPTLAPRLL